MTRRLLILSALGAFLWSACAAASSSSSTAAATDWLAREQLPPEQLQELPAWCAGAYIEPEIPPSAGSGLVSGLAARAEKDLDGSRLSGGASLTDGSRRVAADEIHVNLAQDEVFLEGDVSIRQPGLLLQGSAGHADLVSEAAELADASLLVHSARLRGEAERLTRTGDGRLLIERGGFTRCAPTSKAWSVSGKSMQLEPESGFGTAEKVVVRVRNLPIAWFPWLRFPLDDRRHSGFLAPNLSHDSEGGLDLTLPYYFNLAPQADATYSFRPVQERGLVHEGQLRFLAADSLNELNVGYLHRDRTQEPPAGATGARWYLNLRHEGGWDRRWASRIRYTSVSDLHYLEDLGGDLDPASGQQYYGTVDASLGNQGAVLLDRFGQLEYRGDAWNYLLRVQGFQQLSPEAVPPGYMRLPQLAASWRRRHANWQPSLAMEAVRFARNNEVSGAERGRRLSLTPALAWSLRSSYGYLRPRLELDYRRYFLEQLPAAGDESPEFVLPAFSLDAGLYLDRFFDLRGRRHRQTLEPRLFYLRRGTAIEQNSLPLFDTGELTPSWSAIFRHDRFAGRDRVGDANQLAMGLTQRLVEETTGREKLRFSVGRIRYFAARRVLHPNGLLGLDPTATLSPVFAELISSPHRHLRLLAALEVEPEDGDINRASLALRYNRDFGTLFNLSYRRTDERLRQLGALRSVEESRVNFLLPLGNRWSLVGHWNYGWDVKETLEAITGMEYNDCCWRTRMFLRRYRRLPDLVAGAPQGGLLEAGELDTGVYFEFRMKGLGTLGRRLDSLLNHTLPGWRRREEIHAN